MARPSRSRRLRKRLNRRLYAGAYRAYRAIFPTPEWRGCVPRESIRRVLIVQQYGVGDMILTTPLIAFLRERLPAAEIDVLASRRNAAIVADHPAVTRVFSRDHRWRDWMLLLPRLRARRYDVILSGQTGRDLREGLTASLVARRGTYKVSVWRPKRYQGLFTTVVRAPRAPAHAAQLLLSMAAHALGTRAPSLPDTGGRYALRVTTDAGAAARAEALVGDLGGAAFVLANVSAQFAVRDWPPDHCATSLRLLLSRHPELRVLVTPAPGKVPAALAVARYCASPRLTVAPVLSLAELVAVVRQASAVVTPNTALVHIAAACGKPVVALYAPQARGEVDRWLPLGVPHRALASPTRGSIGDIRPESVADAFENLWRARGADHAAQHAS